MSERLLLKLDFPRDLSVDAVVGALRTLAGYGGTRSLAPRFIVRGDHSGIHHFLVLPESQRDLARRLELQTPGLKIAESPEPLPVPRHVWKLWQSTSRRPLRTDRPELSTRALLVALTGLRRGETVEVHWQLGPIRRPQSVGNRQSQLSEGWVRALLTASVLPPGDLDGDARGALRQKLSEPAWRGQGLIAIRAANRGRATQLARTLMAAIRTAEGPGVQIGIRRTASSSLTRRPWIWPMHLNATELAGLIAWPITPTAQGLPAAVRGHRELEPQALPRTGRRLGSTASGKDLRLSDSDSLRHLHVMGPSGTGKSTLLLNLILQDIEAGKSVVVIDPKGDLVTEVLERYPLKRLDELVVLDPTAEAPVGLNPLHKPSNPELAADQLLSIFGSLYPNTLGPRTTDVMHAGLLTLARWGQGSLAVLPLLLSNPGLRRRIVGVSHDPLGTAPFWRWFERISEPERQMAIAPAMNRLRPFLLRPDLRAVMGQVEPRFNLSDVVRHRRVLLAALPSGSLGPKGAATMGTVLLNQLWQLIQARAAVPVERRHPIAIYIDEFQEFMHLPTDLADVLVRARGLGAALTLAHQHLGQLPPDVKAAVLSSARSRIVFQLGMDDARVIARGREELAPEDLAGLPAFEAYASLLVDNRVHPFASLRTDPAPPASSTARMMRAASSDRYGVPRSETERALHELAEPAGDEPLGRRPRNTS